MEGESSGGTTNTLVTQLSSLVPTYDPSKDDLQVYTQKVELLVSAWPESKYGELVTRLVLGCQGTAFQKLQLNRSSFAANDKKSVMKVIELLGGQWGQIPLEKKFEAAERALYRCQQRSDETNDSYLARADVLWQELLNKGMQIDELQAYITLRGANLNADDKKRVLIDSDINGSGKLTMTKVHSSVRMLGAGFFQEMTSGKRGTKLKTYDQAAMILEEVDVDDPAYAAMGDDDPNEDELIDVLVADGDEDACLVAEFETAAQDLLQEDPELAAAFSTYSDARKRLAEKFRHRGFFPTSGYKGKGKSSKSMSGKGKTVKTWSFGSNQKKSLQQRILNSTCRICGKRGHWKAECPERSEAGSSTRGASNSGGLASNTSFTGTAIIETPPQGLPLTFMDLQEFGQPIAKDSHKHVELSFYGDTLSQGEKLKIDKSPPKFWGSGTDQTVQSIVRALRARNERNSCRSETYPLIPRGDILSPPASGTLPDHEALAGVATDYSNRSHGVLDSGATKTVIGSNLVESLLQSLHPEVRTCVKRCSCDVTFRFGNLSTLDAKHALVIPVGYLNLRVAIVQGNTPFLISNTLMRALKAVLDSHHQELRSPMFHHPIKLQLSNRGLFLLDVNELVKSTMNSSHVGKCQATFVSEEVKENPKFEAEGSPSTSLESSKERVQGNTPSDSTILSETDSREAISCTDCTQAPPFTSANISSSKCVSDSVDNVVHRQHVVGAGPTSCQDSESRAGGVGGSRSILSSPTVRDEDRLWKHSSRQNLSSSLVGASRLGEVVPITLRQQHQIKSSQGGPLLLTGNREVRTGRSYSAECRSASRTESSTAFATKDTSQVEGLSSEAIQRCCRDAGVSGSGVARGDGSLERDGVRHGVLGPTGTRSSERDHLHDQSNGSHGEHAESDRCPPEQASGSIDASHLERFRLEAGDIDCDEALEPCLITTDDNEQRKFHGLVRQFRHELEDTKHHMSKNIRKLKKDRPLLFEVFCGHSSQLTNQCRNLGKSAQRFGLFRNDLHTQAGRRELFEQVIQEDPQNIWFSPSCGPWCAFSNLNGSRSIEAWEKMHHNRIEHLQDLALGIVLLQHQIETGNHLHWEQPQRSVMFRLPFLSFLFVNTWAAEFNMCQMGLRDPQTQLLIQKGMTVMTTSWSLYQTLHGKKCHHDHQHQVIEGSVKVNGEIISRSTFTENYPRKFARQVMITLMKINSHDYPKPSHSEALAADHPESSRQCKKPRLVQSLRAGVILPRVSEPSQLPESKRRRLGTKQEVVNPEESWKNLFDLCHQHLPRVGRQIFDHGEIFQAARNLIVDKQVCFVVAGRGMDRTTGPCKEVTSGEAPFRKCAFIHRATGKIQIEDNWESWEQLSKRQLVRRSHPCKINITFFARNPDHAEHQQVSQHEEKSHPPRTAPGVSLLDTASVPNPEKSQSDIDISSRDDQTSKIEPRSHNPESITEEMGKSMGHIQQTDLQSQRHGPKFCALSQEDKQMIIKAHSNLGHPAPDRLKTLFQQQGYSKNIIDALNDFQCSTCIMTSKPKLSRPASIKDTLDFNDRIAMDGLKITTAQNQVFHLYHIIDIGTSFHAAIIAPSRSSEDAIQALIQAWLSWAGAPLELIVDSASELNSESFANFLQKYNIRCHTVAPDAHWQNGRAERHGAVLEDMIQRVDKEFPILNYSDLQRQLWHIVQAKNSCSLRKGFSPETLVFGKNARLPGSICGDDQIPAHCLADAETGAGVAFRDQLMIREAARRAFHQADNSSALRRALLRRNRPSRGEYQPGEWIMMWKTQGNQSSWVGPMQVVVQQSNLSIWATMCGKLYRGPVENVRPVSALEAKNIPAESQTPMHKLQQMHQQVTTDGNEGIIVEDLTPLPPMIENNTEDVENPVNPNPGGEEVPGTTSTASQPDQEPEMPETPTGINPPVEAHEVPVPETSSTDDELIVTHLISTDEEPILFVQDDMRHVAWRLEIEVDQRDIDNWKSEDNPDDLAFLVTAAKRQRAEVKLSSLNESEAKEFKDAKRSEIMNWLRTDTVCKMLRNQLSPEEVLRCRWVLTWKPIEPKDQDPKNPKERKAKARLVVLGYLDPAIDKLTRDSPTLSKHSRMLLLQVLASYGWDLRSFDIKAAFLQGKPQEDRVIGVEPVPELVEALGLKGNEICRLTKSAYGLIDAPYLWFKTLNEELHRLGFESSPFDPCLYVLRSEKNELDGILGIHVDDGLCGGNDRFQQKIRQLQQKYPFGSQKMTDFVFTGIHLSQRSDKGIVLSQSEYVKNIKPIHIDPNRKSQRVTSVNEDERQQLRALIGSLQYAATNTRPDLASRLSYLQSRINNADVETLCEGNKILHEAKRHHDVAIRIQPIAVTDLRFLAFSDASFASKANPDSHTGSIILATHRAIEDNISCTVSPLSWGCKKIQKVVTSTLAAETMSLASTLDQLSWIRLFWAWIHDGTVDWRQPEKTLPQLPKSFSSNTQKDPEFGSAVAATDCKSLFDLVTRTAPPSCSEFRTQLQAKAIKDFMNEGVNLRWVHSGAQLADALTKIMEAHFLRETLRLGKYKLHDEQQILKQRLDNRTRLKWLQNQEESTETKL